MNGMGATKLIRQPRGGQRLPVIALTANAFGEYRAYCMAAGVAYFFGRPCESPVSLARVLQLLDRGKTCGVVRGVVRRRGPLSELRPVGEGSLDRRGRLCGWATVLP